MRRTFLIWLSAVICTTFVIMGALVYSQFARHAREKAEQMMATRLNDILELFMHAERSVSYLSMANDASTQDRTRALVEILSLKPEILLNQEELQGVCNLLGAEQIAVCNSKGVVEAAVPESFVGYNLEDGDDIYLLTGGDERQEQALCSPMASADTESQGVMQFATVRRLDKEGFVRLGFRTRLEHASRQESSLDHSTAKLRVGENGRVVVFRRGVRVSNRSKASISQTELLAMPTNEVKEVTIDGDEYFLYAVEGNGYRLVGVVPRSEIYRSSLGAVKSVLLSNLLLFFIMFAVVSWLLQRIVLRGISKINEELREITEGDLERRIDVTDSLEFARLSNGINFMVDSLRSVAEERQQGIKRALELARTIQTTVLPDKFPAFPHITAFDLYACCLQASEVGGDFYDFSMPDEKHLHFLVADVDASGIPAALFMMRAMSIVRTLTRSGAAPCSIVAEANQELCEGNQTGIRMALFYASLNIETGELSYVNAGGLCALRQHKGGDYEVMDTRSDYILGEKKGLTFHTRYETLEPGDRLLLYTEGVMRVTNTNNTPYSGKQLHGALRTEADTVTDVLHLVRSSLRKYAEGQRFRRDITMLCLEFRGAPSNHVAAALPAGDVAKAEEMIAERLEELFVSPLDIADVQNSVTTVLSTLPPDTAVNFEMKSTEKETMITLSFPPPPFNPLEHTPALPMDQSTFEYIEDQENKLTLWKTLT